MVKKIDEYYPGLWREKRPWWRNKIEFEMELREVENALEEDRYESILDLL